MHQGGSIFTQAGPPPRRILLASLGSTSESAKKDTDRVIGISIHRVVVVSGASLLWRPPITASRVRVARVGPQPPAGTDGASDRLRVTNFRVRSPATRPSRPALRAHCPPVAGHCRPVAGHCRLRSSPAIRAARGARRRHRQTWLRAHQARFRAMSEAVRPLRRVAAPVARLVGARGAGSPARSRLGGAAAAHWLCRRR